MSIIDRVKSLFEQYWPTTASDDYKDTISNILQRAMKNKPFDREWHLQPDDWHTQMVNMLQSAIKSSGELEAVEWVITQTPLKYNMYYLCKVLDTAYEADKLSVAKVVITQAVLQENLKTALRWLCSSDYKVEIVRWILRNNNRSTLLQSFNPSEIHQELIEKNKLSVARWVVKQHGEELGLQSLNEDDECQAECGPDRSCAVEVVKWILGNVELTKTLELLRRNADIEEAKWLTKCIAAELHTRSACQCEIGLKQKCSCDRLVKVDNEELLGNNPTLCQTDCVLMWATIKDQPELVKWLLENSAINSQQFDQVPKLNSTYNELSAEHASRDKLMSSLNAILEAACSGGKLEVVQWLLKQQNNMPNKLTLEKALHAALINGKREIAAWIMRHECVENLNNPRRTATTTRGLEFIELLLSINSSVLVKRAEPLLIQKNSSNFSQWMVECLLPMSEIFIFSTQSKLDNTFKVNFILTLLQISNQTDAPCLECNRSHEEAIRWIATYSTGQYSHLVMNIKSKLNKMLCSIRLFSEQDIGLSVLGSKIEDKKNSILIAACYLNRLDVTQFLLVHFPNIDVSSKYKNFTDNTPLHEAIFSESSTPLHVSCYNGDKEKLWEQINDNFDVDVQDNEGYTPLHVACYMGHIELVERLLTAGASATITNNDQQTALQIAKEKNYPEIVALIERPTNSSEGTEREELVQPQ